MCFLVTAGFDGSDSPRPSPRPPPRPKTSGVPRLGINNSALSSKAETPNVKKRHRRAKSGGIKNIDPSQGDGAFADGDLLNLWP